MPSSLNQLATAIAKQLQAKNLKLATAESCTGGGVAYFMTNIPGSSAWFERGFITYSNTAKEEMLNVKHETLLTHGAVSELTAREMAEGALRHSHAEISIAITGVAGPDGGTSEKPVGTVWFAWAGENFVTETKLFLLTGDRLAIREQAIQIALENLLGLLQ
jgi:nicotinamide-nucleotide amidase